jgi:hypothetical protein
MTMLSEENLRRCVELGMSNPNWRWIAAQIGVGESTMYNWLSRSERDSEKRLEATSPLYIEVDPVGADWWHRHMLRSRAANVLAMASIVQDQVVNGIEETVFNPQTGRPLQLENPEYLGRSDEWMLDNFLDPARDRYLWTEDGTPRFLTKITQAPAAIKIKLLTGLLPRIFGDKVSHDVTVRGAVVHTTEPPRFAADSVPAVEDAEFTEVREALPAPVERDDISALRRAAAELLERGPKNPTPTAPVDLGAPRGEEKPTSEYQGGPKGGLHDPAIYKPQPKQEPPSYARRSSVDAARTSPRGGNLDRSIK